jgi:hypothetical protein
MTPEQRAAIHTVCRHQYRLDEVNKAGVPMLSGRPLRLSPRDRLWLALTADSLLRFIGSGQAALVQQLDDLARAKVTQKRLNEFCAWHVLFPTMVEDYADRLARYRAEAAAATAVAGVDP